MRKHWRARLFRAVAALLVGLSAVACGDDGGSFGPEGTEETPEGAEGTRDENGCPTEGNTFEGEYDENEMELYFNCTAPYIDLFVDALNTEMGLNIPQPLYVFVPSGETVQQACVDEQGSHGADDESYHYCPADDTIYIGEAATWREYQDPSLGDMALAFSWAHEEGHDIQGAVGQPDPQDNQENIMMENQADCVAGVWLFWMEREGILEEGDLPQTQVLVESLASVESTDRDHGTIQERVDAVNYGYQFGLVACDNYFHPITS
jgi:predicted metalloprotease